MTRQPRLPGNTPSINFSMDLPMHAGWKIYARLCSIIRSLWSSGATGSGKTTQLPKLCLARYRGSNGLIGHTQPRRIAAQTVAARIAKDPGELPGRLVGFQIRHTDRTTDVTRIKVMTDSALLSRLQHDRRLERHDAGR